MTVKSYWKQHGISIRDILWGNSLPSNVYRRGNSFQVIVGTNKRSKSKYVGSFPNLDDAITARDEYLQSCEQSH